MAAYVMPIKIEKKILSICNYTSMHMKIQTLPAKSFRQRYLNIITKALTTVSQEMFSVFCLKDTSGENL